MITIRTDGFAPIKSGATAGASGQTPWGVSAIAAAAALVLFCLAVPRVWTYAARAPGDASKQDMLLDMSERTFSGEELSALIESRELPAARMTDIARASTDLAQAYLIRAERAGLATSAGKEDLARAMAAQEEALAHAPVDPFGWMRLAYLRSRSGAPISAVAQAFILSLETGPYEPSLAKSRMLMMAMLRKELPPEMWEGWPSQARMAWRKDPSGTFLAARLSQTSTELRQALADDAQDVQRFDAMQAKWPKLAPHLAPPQGGDASAPPVAPSATPAN